MHAEYQIHKCFYVVILGEYPLERLCNCCHGARFACMEPFQWLSSFLLKHQLKRLNKFNVSDSKTRHFSDVVVVKFKMSVIFNLKHLRMI